jgi:hypothetical protein
MLNVNVCASFFARKEVEPKPLDSQNCRTHWRLRAFVIADLSIDLVPVRTHVRPGAGEIFGSQARI